MNEVFGRKLGHYVLLEQLGEGGMAKVYNAIDSRVEGNVAIKVILPSKRTSSVFLQQFEREAKALANLTHTNIVKVLNYGVQDGQPYLVMEYVAGGTLKEAMNQKMPWQTAAAILAPIARALDYVHRQQIVHRDVKPSNILLQEDFTPMLSDFGILKLLEGKDVKVDSAIGAGIGTPEYMAPEQGMGKEVDFRADIYSLGMVFYEMITGQKPYTADTPMAVVIKHVTDQLPLPTHIDRNIPRFVERAILRAVQKNPKNRYLSMGHFADVLEMIAQGDKISPQKINRVSSEKEKRQRSWFIVTLSVLLLALVAGTSFFAYNYFILGQATVLPPATASPGVKPLQIPATTVAATLTTVPPPAGTKVSPETGPSSSITLLGTPIAQNAGAQFKEIARWGIGGVNVVRWAPDGSTIALGTTSGIFIYDSVTKEMKVFIDTQFNVLEMTFNPAGDAIAAGSVTGIVRTWSSSSGKLIQNFTYKRPISETIATDIGVTALAYSTDGANLAVGYHNGAINYFPSNQGTANLAVENYPIAEDLAVSKDNRFIYASNGGKDITVWDLQSGEKAPELLTNPTPVKNIALLRDRDLLLAGGGGNSVYLWDLIEERLVSSFSNLGGQVNDFDVSNDGQYVAIGLNTGEIIFRIPAPEDYSKIQSPLTIIPAFKDPLLSVAFAPDQFIIASGNETEGLRLWDAATGKNAFSLEQSMARITRMYFSSDGHWLASAHEDGLLRIWDINQAKEAYPPLEGKLPRGVPFSPDSHFLAYSYSPGRNKLDAIRVVDLNTGQKVAELPDFQARSLLRFSPDSRILVMGNEYSASLWDVTTWEQLDTHGGPTAGCGHYFTPQNKPLLIISSMDILFREPDEKLEQMCGTKPPGTTPVYYSYDQHRMLFVLSSGKLWSWNFNSSDIGRVKAGAPYPVPGEIFLAVDESSGWYAYKDLDLGKLRIESIKGASGTTIDGQNDYQYQVALLPGHHLMALGSKYGSIHIWTMP